MLIASTPRLPAARAGDDAATPSAPTAAPASALADVYEAPATPPTPRASSSAASPVAAGQPDASYDGMFAGAGGATYDPARTSVDDVPAVKPEPGAAPPTGRRTVFVNGIDEPRAVLDRDMQALANATGDEVVGVYNAGDGVVSDVVQSAGDRAGVGANKAADTVTKLVYEHVSLAKPLSLAGHSQGAAIISRALRDVDARLDAEDGVAFDLSGAQRELREQLLSRVSVATYGGAAASYPDGPSYTHHINTNDLVSTAFGLTRKGAADLGLTHPGRGAVVDEFTSDGVPSATPGLGPHLLDSYLALRPR